ncbi:DUF5666 domain-containing protein [Nocardia spumae]|uniref:DUF5666 domain-containing protein n=1 Tax=Nocardia spumae TaxID=2887190 RepID=UPI001D15BDED|nr:DUF5666 domain-containing protein [Nocardia spumae]
MTNPSDPWAQRPDSPDTPTEKLGASGRDPGDTPTHTTEYSEAYGRSPEPYQSTLSYGHPGPYEQTKAYEFPEHPDYQGRQYFEQSPGPNATREIPPYDSQWGGYESGYGESGGYPPYGSGPAGADGRRQAVGPTGLPVESPRRRTGLWIALTAAVFVLVVLGGIAAGLLLAGNDSSSSTDAATGRPAPTRVPIVPPNPSGAQPSLPQLPGLGDIDGIGATMGTVTTNDGATIVIQSLLGSSVTVHTNADTQIISAGAGKVSDLHQGDMVVVQGDKGPDGAITAKIIISTQLPR